MLVLLVKVLDDLAETLSKQSENRNVAKRIVEVPRFRQLAQLVFPDKDALESFLNTAAAESTFSKTRNTILGGSPTARILSDRKAATDSIGGLLFDGVTNPGSTMAQALRSTLNNSKLTDDVLKELGDILLDPKVVPEALKPPRFSFNFTPNPVRTAGLIGGAVGSQVGLLNPQGGVITHQEGELNPYIDEKRKTFEKLRNGKSLAGKRE